MVCLLFFCRDQTTESSIFPNYLVQVFASCRCLRNKRPSKPYDFIGLGAMDVTKLYKFKGFGDIHGPKPYKFIGFLCVFISQTPAVNPAIRFLQHQSLGAVGSVGISDNPVGFNIGFAAPGSRGGGPLSAF